MALKTFECNRLMALHFKGLKAAYKAPYEGHKWRIIMAKKCLGHSWWPWPCNC